MRLSPRPGARDGRRIGLLGGSFNPAHEGHRHISLAALARLGLDEVWWLVSPQNPLKPVKGMAPFAERLASAAHVANHPRIKASDLESRLGTHFTADTLEKLQARFPLTKFVWLMGADNLSQIPRWRRWNEIFHRLPIAVFARPSYCLKGLAGLAAKRYARWRIDPGTARRLADCPPPAWVFLATKLDPSSATEIRAQAQKSKSKR